MESSSKQSIVCSKLSKHNIKHETPFNYDKRLSFLNTVVDTYEYDEIVNIVANDINKKNSIRIISLNSFKIDEIYNNSYLREIVNTSKFVIPDGYSVVLGVKKLYKKTISRITGIDLMDRLLEFADIRSMSVYFLGASDNTLNTAISNIKTKYHNIKINKHNGYFALEELDDVINDVNNDKPDIIFVGLSSPYKEYLINYFQNKGINSVYVGVGGAFEVLAEKSKRAPIFVQNAGFEWAYRLFQEPKRLCKRYLLCNSKFMFRLLKERLRADHD